MFLPDGVCLEGVEIRERELFPDRNISYRVRMVRELLVDVKSHVGSAVVVEAGYIREVAQVVTILSWDLLRNVHLERVGEEDVADVVPAELPQLARKCSSARCGQLHQCCVEDALLLVGGERVGEFAVDHVGRLPEHDALAALDGPVGQEAYSFPWYFSGVKWWWFSSIRALVCCVVWEAGYPLCILLICDGHQSAGELSVGVDAVFPHAMPWSYPSRLVVTGAFVLGYHRSTRGG